MKLLAGASPPPCLGRSSPSLAVQTDNYDTFPFSSSLPPSLGRVGTYSSTGSSCTNGDDRGMEGSDVRPHKEEREGGRGPLG